MTKIPQMINDQSRRLRAIAPIQGTGDECRSWRTSCLDRGMAYPSDFVAENTTRSVAVPTQPVGRWWDRINQPTQRLSAQWDAHRQAANGGIGLPIRAPARDGIPDLLLCSLTASRTGRCFASPTGRCFASPTGRCFASPGERRAHDAELSARRTPSRSRNGRARCGCPRENRAPQRSGAALQACPGCRTS